MFEIFKLKIIEPVTISDLELVTAVGRNMLPMLNLTAVIILFTQIIN